MGGHPTSPLAKGRRPSALPLVPPLAMLVGVRQAALVNATLGDHGPQRPPRGPCAPNHPTGPTLRLHVPKAGLKAKAASLVGGAALWLLGVAKFPEELLDGGGQRGRLLLLGGGGAAFGLLHLRLAAALAAQA